MSRCNVCNVVMSEEELKNKDPLTGRYTDMCFGCIGEHEALVNDVDDTQEMVYVSGVETTDDGDFDDWDE